MNVDIIFEKGLTLSETEQAFLAKSSWSLNKQIRRIMKRYPDKGFTYVEMRDVLTQAHGKPPNIDSVRRGITQQTNVDSRLQELEDRYGRMPLIKTPEKRPSGSGVNISVYKWNDRYGQAPSHREIVQKNAGKQQNFHGDLFEGTK